MRTKQAIRRLKAILEKRRAALRRTLTNDIDDFRSGTGIEYGDVAEVALDDTFELVSSQLAETESRELVQIESALQRIRRGTYGVCPGCENEIPLARLQALPYVTRCVECERVAEKKRRSGASPDRWSGISESDEEAEPYNPFFDHVADIF